MTPVSAGASAVPSTVAPAPTFANAVCPEDVTRDILISVSCGWLTVPESRVASGGRTIRLLVVRFDPPGVKPTADPIIVLGDERLGTTPNYGGLAELSQRVHRVEYVIDPRGGGHSEPSLQCPEVIAASEALVGLRLRDPANRTQLLAAVASCHDRLVASGVDLAAYDFAASAADLHDLRVALGITTWNGQAFGPASELAFVEAGLYPEGLRALVIDSPSLIDPNAAAAGPAALDLAISRASAACAAAAPCAAHAPDLARLIAAAVGNLDAAPRTFDVAGTPHAILAGHPTRVVVDGAGLLRYIRSRLGGEYPDVGSVVAAVNRVLAGTLAADDPAVVQLSTDVGDCLGMLPLCDDVNFGTIYSDLCRDSISDAARAALEAGVAGRPAYADIFLPGPIRAACDAWGVTPVRPVPAGPFAGGAPVLILRGALDPFSATPDEIELAAAHGGNPFLVEVPNASYDVLGPFECARAIRNAWVDDPLQPPADTSCLAAIPAADTKP